MRQHMRRFTRQTNGHSKKIGNHVAMSSSIRPSIISPGSVVPCVCPGYGRPRHGSALGYRRYSEADRGMGNKGAR
jgi:hypothetical protein